MGISSEHVIEVMEAASALGSVASLDNQLVEEEYDAYYSEASPENNLDSIMIKGDRQSGGPGEAGHRPAAITGT